MYLRAYTPWKIFSTCSLMWFFYLSKIPPLKSNTYVTKVPFCQTCFQVRTCRSRQASRLTIRAWPREHTIGNPPTGKHRVLTRMEIRWNQVQIHVPPTSTLDLPNVMWWVGVPKKALSAVSFLSRWWPTWLEMCRLCCTYGSFLMTAWQALQQPIEIQPPHRPLHVFPGWC